MIRDGNKENEGKILTGEQGKSQRKSKKKTMMQHCPRQLQLQTINNRPSSKPSFCSSLCFLHRVIGSCSLVNPVRPAS